MFLADAGAGIGPCRGADALMTAPTSANSSTIKDREWRSSDRIEDEERAVRGSRCLSRAGELKDPFASALAFESLEDRHRRDHNHSVALTG